MMSPVRGAHLDHGNRRASGWNATGADLIPPRGRSRLRPRSARTRPGPSSRATAL